MKLVARRNENGNDGILIESNLRIRSRSLGNEDDREKIDLIYKKIDYYENFVMEEYRNKNINDPEILTMVYKQLNDNLDRIIGYLE